MRLHSISTLCACSCFLLGLTAPLAVASPIVYNVSVNTLSVLSQYGYVDMQFNPGGGGSQPATAAVTNFTVVLGALNTNPSDSYNGTNGDASGTLGPTTSENFDNHTATNELTEDLMFGSKITFTLTLDGPLIENANKSEGPTTFYLDFINSSQNANLLTNDPSGYVGYVTINPDGSTTVTENAGPTGGSSVVSFTLASSGGAVPEPSTLLLLSGGLLAVGLTAHRKRN